MNEENCVDSQGIDRPQDVKIGLPYDVSAAIARQHSVREHLEFSRPLLAEELQKGVPYLVRYADGEGNATNLVWSFGYPAALGQILWAALAEYRWNEYHQCYVELGQNGELIARTIHSNLFDGSQLRFCLDDKWLRWAKSNVNDNTPIQHVHIVAGNFNHTYKLATPQFGKYVTKNDNWLEISGGMSNFTFHRQVISADAIRAVLASVFPGASMHFEPTLGGKFEAVDPGRLDEIYKSVKNAVPKDLKSYNYTDYSFLFKAYAGLPANKSTVFADYAVGIIWGRSRFGELSAMNFAVTTFGDFVLINPATGLIFSPDKWVDANLERFRPDFATM